MKFGTPPRHPERSEGSPNARHNAIPRDPSQARDDIPGDQTSLEIMNFVSIVNILQQHASDYPNQIAIKFLTHKGYETLTYRELNIKAHTLAQVLQQHHAYNASRAVILLPPGLDYIIVFLACLYAGVIAVPVYPPRKNQHANRVFSILDDSNAAFVITNQLLAEQFPNYNVINIDSMDKNPKNQYHPIVIDQHKIAFIQYTSGSTSNPKGVLISHRNIMANLKVLQNMFPAAQKHKVCSWLPPYHDMGLIGAILCPLYIKAALILMPPAHFLQSPLRWLEIISKEKITMTVAPNFAFELCVKKISPEHINQLDLSSLLWVCNGSEPIQLESLQRFNKAFHTSGFSPQAFYCSYGLAESTLMLTAKQFNDIDNSLSLIKSDFELGKISISKTPDDKPTLTIINCGKTQHDHSIRIVDPQSLQCLPEGQIGEIWASGPSIAKGYWNQAELTKTSFNNQLADTPGVDYLRTNDLGFIYQGDLYVTGRMHDLMTLQGRTYYPQDIEQAAVQSHPAFEFKGAAAFSIEVDGMSQIVLLQEIKREALRQIEPELLFSKLKSVLLDFGLMPHSLVLLKPYTLPKTSSGKIRRNAAKTAFIENSLSSIECWTSSRPLQARDDEIQFNTKQWLANWLFQHLQLSLADEDYDKSIVELGINSITAVELSNDIQHKLGSKFELFELFERCSLNELIAILTEHCSSNKELENIATIKSIYLNVNDGISSNVTTIDGQQYINYSGYNYLGLSGHPIVIEAVVAAIKKLGTSVSASRLVSGEKSLHIELETAIANLIGAEDCLVLPSGYSTNVTIITHLFTKQDLIIHDELAHNSIIQAALFSGAERISFPHNNYQSLTDFLEKYRSQYKKVLIVTEGIFSMDGDIPDVKKLIQIKKKFAAFLMIDEAHSMGVLGKTGCGIREHYDLDAKDIDIWMGTLSKSFASCGGYIAGSKELIENFKYTAAGFVYSAGISPSNTAAALAAIQVMNQEPERIHILQSRHSLLLSLLKQQGIPTGLSQHTPIIPLIVGDDLNAIQLSRYLKENHILALPIIYPAVEKNQARVRLFINCLHTEDQLYNTAKVLEKARDKAILL